MNELSPTDTMERQIVNAPDAPRPSGAGAEGILVRRANHMLLLSGQVALDPEDHCPSNFDEQARLAWKNVEAQLASVGRGLDDIVKVTTFLVDRRYAEENKSIRNEIMAGRTFANTLVIAGLYDPNWLIEVEVIALW